MLDEFYALGRLQFVAKAAGLLAGYGVKLWPIALIVVMAWSPPAHNADHAGLIATVDASPVIGAVPEPASAALVLSAIFLLGTVRLRTYT